jgi:hypothetical protein
MEKPPECADDEPHDDQTDDFSYSHEGHDSPLEREGN